MKKSPAGRSGNRAARWAKLRRSLRKIVYCSPAKARSDSPGSPRRGTDDPGSPPRPAPAPAAGPRAPRGRSSLVGADQLGDASRALIAGRCRSARRPRTLPSIARLRSDGPPEGTVSSGSAHRGGRSTGAPRGRAVDTVPDSRPAQSPCDPRQGPLTLSQPAGVWVHPPSQPMRERAGRHVGIIDDQRQRDRLPRHGPPVQTEASVFAHRRSTDVGSAHPAQNALLVNSTPRF